MGNNDNQELFNELNVDNFAGGGGPSEGIFLASVRANLPELCTPNLAVSAA
jgi:hypothetical protein